MVKKKDEEMVDIGDMLDRIDELVEDIKPPMWLRALAFISGTLKLLMFVMVLLALHKFVFLM